MLYIIGGIGAAGCLIAIILLLIFHAKDKSKAVPLIMFVMCFLLFIGSGMLHSVGFEIKLPSRDSDSKQGPVDDTNNSSSSTVSESNSDDTLSADGNSKGEDDSEKEDGDKPDVIPDGFLSVGESSELGNWEIVVTDFEITPEIVSSEYTSFSPDDGNQYAVVSVSITNNGKESDRFLPSFALNSDVSATIHYAGEYEFSPTVLLGYDSELHDTYLNPLSTKSGCISFEIPESVVESSESLVITFSQGRDSVTYSLR